MTDTHSHTEGKDLAPFQYSDLPSNSIRIFELSAGDHSTPITGTLEQIRLADEHKPYQALSYAWGETTLAETIVCNGCLLRVTSNLLHTLTRLRRPDENLVLWVDAICINQGTDPTALEERAQEVAKMSQIFAHAFQVIVDFGPLAHNFAYLLSYLEQYARLDADKKVIQIHVDVQLPGSDRLDRLDARLWIDLFTFMQLPWFQRLWCFQELVMARKTIGLVGHQFVTHFDMFIALVRAMNRYQVAADEPAVDKTLKRRIFIRVN